MSHVGQLPQRHAESVLLQLLHEALRVREPLGVELPLAQPVGAEPPCVQVDDIARVVLAAQTVADVIHLVGREIGHAAHPDAKRPQRWHLREARQHAVATQDFLGALSANEEHIERGTVVEKLHRAGRVVG